MEWDESRKNVRMNIWLNPKYSEFIITQNGGSCREISNRFALNDYP
jgi:hypothetical protein